MNTVYYFLSMTTAERETISNNTVHILIYNKRCEGSDVCQYHVIYWG